ncbi:MAG TPA: terminase [Alphaproteobacteria bacterium]|nr:terminase [Alphaproteobacteria bacterium]
MVFLAHLRQTANVTEAAQMINMARRSLYDARERDPEFAKQWDDAVEEATDALEREARRRAVEGWDEPVFYKGQLQGYIRRYSDRMLELLLRAHRPDKFSERVNLHLVVKREIARIEQDVSLTEDEKQQLIRDVEDYAYGRA